jgi:hypothetical protein
MDFIVLLFFIATPVGFLIWTLRFKKFFAVLAGAPSAFLLIIALALNADPTIQTPQSSQCLDVIRNSTATVVSNVTTTTYGVDVVCPALDPISHAIPPEVMTVFNVMIFSFVTTVAFVILRRVTRDDSKEEEE